MSDFNFRFPTGGEGEGAQEAQLPLPPKRNRTRNEDTATQTARIKAETHMSGLVTTEVVQPRADYDPEELKNRSVPLPNRIWDALAAEARRNGKTAKYYILKGLQLQGFPVADSDLVDKRGLFIKEAARRRREQG